jgi:hypothetical protein
MPEAWSDSSLLCQPGSNQLDVPRERQREGIAIAKKAGAYKGRKPSLTAEQVSEIRKRAVAGKQKTGLAAEYGCPGRHRTQRWLKRTTANQPPVCDVDQAMEQFDDGPAEDTLLMPGRNRRVMTVQLSSRSIAFTSAMNSTSRPSASILGLAQQPREQGVSISALSNPIVCQNVDRSNTTQLIIPTMKSQGSVSRGHTWDVLIALKPTN